MTRREKFRITNYKLQITNAECRVQSAEYFKLLCHSERSIEDAESKNPLLFDGAFTPHPPRLTPGHLLLKEKALRAEVVFGPYGEGEFRIMNYKLRITNYECGVLGSERCVFRSSVSF